MEWYTLIFVAIIIEALITYAKTFVVDKKIQWQVIASPLRFLISVSFLPAFCFLVVLTICMILSRRLRVLRPVRTPR